MFLVQYNLRLVFHIAFNHRYRMMCIIQIIDYQVSSHYWQKQALPNERSKLLFHSKTGLQVKIHLIGNSLLVFSNLFAYSIMKLN